jgi:hypothetical protein
MRRPFRVLLVLAAAAAVAVALYLAMLSPPAPYYQPSRPVEGGVSVIALEGILANYTAVAAVGEYAAVPLWGAWRARSNATLLPLVVDLADAGCPFERLVLVFGIASTRGVVNQSLGNGFRAYADARGGYVIVEDKNVEAGWCLREPEVRDGVYVWLPASRCSLEDYGERARFVIEVSPETGAVRVNGTPVFPRNATMLSPRKGVLPGWWLRVNRNGTYYIAAAP